MNTASIILTLQPIKGIGAKAISSLSLEKLSDCSDVNALNELLRENFENNRRIQLPSLVELSKIIDNNLQLLDRSFAQGIKAYTCLDHNFPQSLARLAQPCHQLFVKGDESLLKQKSVAIIGTREVSLLGEKVGRHFAKIVVDQGWAVVSGLAIGCDTSGHVGCLEAGGKTIAILARGLDRIYPKQNTRLAEKIVQSGGCLISEYPIGVEANAYRLIARDRLQSGLSSGVMVVETGEKSGTMHAVNHAVSDNKPLGCCDFDKFSPEHCDNNIHALGNRMLIKNGTAQGLSDPATIAAFLKQCEEYYCNRFNIDSAGIMSQASANAVSAVPEAVPTDVEQLKLF